jgi:hypothetical protein
MDRWRWFLFDFVPPEVSLSRAERRVIRRAVRRGFRKEDRAPGYAIRGGIFLLACLIGTAVIVVAARAGVVPSFVAGFCFFATLHLIAVLIFAPERARRTYRELRARGIDVCPSCGYLLRMLTADAPCPECGAARAPLAPPPLKDIPPADPRDFEPQGLPPGGFDRWRTGPR